MQEFEMQKKYNIFLHRFVSLLALTVKHVMA